MIQFERKYKPRSLVPENFETAMSNFFLSFRHIWQPQLDSLVVGIKKDVDVFNRVPIDKRIIPAVLALRLNGITTNMSCEGHPSRQYINPAESETPYIEFGSCKSHNGAVSENTYLNLYREIETVNNLLSGFKSEIPTHSSNLQVSEITNYSAFLGIEKSHKKESLVNQQIEMNSFADYSLGRYLVTLGYISNSTVL